MIKTCGTCKKDFPIEEFVKDQSRPNGIKLRCKACEANRKKRSPSTQKYRETHREEILEKARIKRAANREEINRKHKEYIERYKAEYPEEWKEKQRLSGERTRVKRAESIKRSIIKKKYGITLEEYAGMKLGGCQVCGSQEVLHIDHDHTTGKVRGCLCNHCNIALGHMKDNPVLLRKLADYIESHL